VATLGTIELGSIGETIGSGAAFLLISPSSQTLMRDVDNQGVVCLEQGNPYAVVKLFQGDHSWKQVLSDCRLLAERALDELSVIVHLDLAVCPGLPEYLVWWVSSKNSRVVRYVSTVSKDIHVTVHVQVTHADGTPSYESIDAATVNSYSQSFRYWRWSKLSANVFDAFRNMYLALENELSVLHPKEQNERSENEWTKNAVSAFAEKCPKGVLSAVCGRQSPESWFMANVYNGVRIKIFHGKDGFDRLMPGSSHDETVVEKVLPVVTRMVEEAWSARKSVCLPSKGVITNAGLQMMASNVSKGCRLAVAGYRADEPPYDSEGRVRTDVAPMKSKPILRTHAPWLAGAEGSSPVEAISAALPLQHILVTDGVTVFLDARLDVPLDLTGFDEFQAQVAVQLHNGLS